MDRADFILRLQRYRSGQQWALAIGALPLLAVYFAVHTRWLKPLMQDHKHLLVALMIVLPLGWIFAVAQAWKRLGPRWLGLRCANCGSSLAGLAPAGEGRAVSCASCGASAIEADTAR